MKLTAVILQYLERRARRMAAEAVALYTPTPEERRRRKEVRK